MAQDGLEVNERIAVTVDGGGEGNEVGHRGQWGTNVTLQYKRAVRKSSLHGLDQRDRNVESCFPPENKCIRLCSIHCAIGSSLPQFCQASLEYSVDDVVLELCENTNFYIRGPLVAISNI